METQIQAQYLKGYNVIGQNKGLEEPERGAQMSSRAVEGKAARI